MANIKVSSGPFKDIVFIGHENADAYDKQAGQVGACVEAADLNDIYRSGLPSAHEAFAPILAKAGVPRGVNADATAKAKQKAKDATKVEDVPEAFVTWANRVKATLEAEGDEGKARWQAIDEEIHGVTLTCDSSPTARQKGPDKGSLAKADEILNREDAAMEATVTKLLNVVEGYDLARDAETGKPERMSLARLVAEFVKASV